MLLAVACEIIQSFLQKPPKTELKTSRIFSIHILSTRSILQLKFFARIEERKRKADKVFRSHLSLAKHDISVENALFRFSQSQKTTRLNIRLVFYVHVCRVGIFYAWQMYCLKLKTIDTANTNSKLKIRHPKSNLSEKTFTRS